MPHNHIKIFYFHGLCWIQSRSFSFYPFKKNHHFASMRCVTFIILPTVIADAQHSRHLPCNALESTQLHYYLTVQVHDLINPAVSKCLSGLPASSESLEPSADRASPKQPILVFHIVTQSGLEHLRSEWLGTSYASTPRMSSIWTVPRPLVIKEPTG